MRLTRQKFYIEYSSYRTLRSLRLMSSDSVPKTVRITASVACTVLKLQCEETSHMENFSIRREGSSSCFAIIS